MAEQTEKSHESKNPGVGRREFFKGAAAGAAAVATTGGAAAAEAAPPPRPAVLKPTEAQAQAEVGVTGSAELQAGVTPGSDFMIDVFRALDLEYVAANPGSTYQGLHESIINYGNNSRPEMLTCLHEESATAMAHAYAKAAGKPMMTMYHGTVGLLHASMAIFQAWADRVPVFAVVGFHRNPTSIINRPHSAQDMGSLVRDFVKWDDEPTTLARFGEAAMRAYQIGTTPPMGPTLLVVDAALQESEVPSGQTLRVPTLSKIAPPQGDAAAVREAAQMLVDAERPVINIQKLARTPRGWDLMIELGELLQTPVNAGGYGSWQDFPSRHPLYGSGGPGYTPDVIMGLEVNDMTGPVRSARANGGKTISICSEFLFQGSNIHDFGNYAEVDLAIAADAEATLPLLIEEVRRAITPDRRRVMDERGASVGAAHTQARSATIQNARFGWNSAPVSVPRLVAELGNQIRNDDWAIVSGHQFTGDWQRRLLNHDTHYRYNGDCGGFGIGYDSPASVGGALAHKSQGRLPIGIVGDGDLNFAPGVLWTAVHHQIPLLLIIHNNRSYHAEVMIVQRMAGRRGRGSDKTHIGNVFTDPTISYAKMAEAYGMYNEGPIDNPNDLAPALERALERVRAGEPALIDVVSQPR